MCRTVQSIVAMLFCGIQMIIRTLMTVLLMIENLVRMILQTFYNFMSFMLQLLSLLPICVVFFITTRLKCFMCGGGGACPVARGGTCDMIMSFLAFIILFLIFRQTGILDKIFFSLGYAKSPANYSTFHPTSGKYTTCSQDTSTTPTPTTTTVPPVQLDETYPDDDLAAALFGVSVYDDDAFYAMKKKANESMQRKCKITKKRRLGGGEAVNKKANADVDYVEAGGNVNRENIAQQKDEEGLMTIEAPVPRYIINHYRTAEDDASKNDDDHKFNENIIVHEQAGEDLKVIHDTKTDMNVNSHYNGSTPSENHPSYESRIEYKSFLDRLTTIQPTITQTSAQHVTKTIRKDDFGYPQEEQNPVNQSNLVYYLM